MNKTQESHNKTIIILHEKVIESIIKDTITFLMFASLLYFNHKVLAGSTVIDVLFIFMVTLMLSTKKNTSRVFCGTPKEAVVFLKEKYKNEDK